ncbi:amidase family protein [Mycolicibacter icosiumassiliensis]|uniref:amidase family protein n=1 Tax=Mycolicibacter icosiumassiliensis TaxID=1792835 RepID=UPI00098F9CDE|nr:amidase family protein [Mycolicibacter icosiumassiliensis]
MSGAHDDDLAFAGVARLAQLVHAREVSPRELATLYLDRIARLDPVLNVFRTVMGDQAMAEAAHVEQRLAAGETLPLAGVPIAVKDDTDVAGVSSMCGTGIDAGPASADSAAVRRLRAAGAVIIGKTHLSEFGAYPVSESATWGVTRNPWDLYRTPGGSSGGSAAAVAAGMVPGATGSGSGGPGLDILMTPGLAIPPVRVGYFEGLGPTRAMLRMLKFIPFTFPQCYSGQPAVSVPVGLSADGIPEAVHLVARANDEATLISLAAQIESVQPWAQLRPPTEALLSQVG